MLLLFDFLDFFPYLYESIAYLCCFRGFFYYYLYTFAIYVFDYELINFQDVKKFILVPENPFWIKNHIT